MGSDPANTIDPSGMTANLSRSLGDRRLEDHFMDPTAADIASNRSGAYASNGNEVGNIVAEHQEQDNITPAPSVSDAITAACNAFVEAVGNAIMADLGSQVAMQTDVVGNSDAGSGGADGNVAPNVDGDATGSGNLGGKTNGNTGPNKDMHLSQSGYGFLKSWEGFSSKMYDLNDGGKTIGYGYHIPPGQEDQYKNGITEEAASALMHSIMGTYENQVKKFITVGLTQNQFDALTIFTYNLAGGLRKATSLVDKVNSNADEQSMRSTWYRYSMPGNSTFHFGLLNRRIDEYEIWNCGDYRRDY